MESVILTSTGPFDPEATKCVQVLPFEHLDGHEEIISQTSNTPISYQDITMQNLATIQQFPSCCVKNLSLDMDTVSRDLNDLGSSDENVIIVNATREFSKIISLPKNISIISSVIGSTAIELEYGIRAGMRGNFCGLIGPIELSDFDSLLIAFNAQECFCDGCPILITANVSMSDKQDGIDFIVKHCRFQSKVAIFNLDPKLALYAIEKSSVYLGFYCPSPGCLSSEKYPNKSSFNSIFELASFLNSLNSDRILLSSGVTLRTHLTMYGGYGYQFLFKWRNMINHWQEYNKNAVIWLSFKWKPFPLAKQLDETLLDCFVCQGKFSESDTHYDKFNFIYCSMKCLSEHRVEKFDKLYKRKDNPSQ